VEPTLAVIGLNSRTSPVAVRERFWGAVVVWGQLLKTNPNYDQNQEVQMLIDRAKMHGAGATKG
jgi:hypothetical protein